jgi:hypothetical protein
MGGSRSKKNERGTPVPSLNFGGGGQVQHNSHTPRMNAFSTGSRLKYKKKESNLNEGQRETRAVQPVERLQVSKRVQNVPHSLEVPSQMPAMTPRGTSSYKDILLTPRFQVQQSRGSMTSRESPGLGNTLGRQQRCAAPSPQTSRLRRGQQQQQHVEVSGSRPMDARVQTNSSSVQSDADLLYHLAGLIKRLETAGDESMVSLQLSKGIQVIARRIGVPAGVLDMLQLHEQQRIAPKVGSETVTLKPNLATRAVNSPETNQDSMQIVTPEVKDKFRSISLKISEIESILLHDMSQ